MRPGVLDACAGDGLDADAFCGREPDIARGLYWRAPRQRCGREEAARREEGDLLQSGCPSAVCVAAPAI